MDTSQDQALNYFASKGNLVAGFSFIGPFSSSTEAEACAEVVGEVEVVEATTCGYTFLITDGQPGSTIYVGYARESSYEKSLKVAFDECAGCWGREDTDGLELVCSIFGDVSFKEFGVGK